MPTVEKPQPRWIRVFSDSTGENRAMWPRLPTRDPGNRERGKAALCRERQGSPVPDLNFITMEKLQSGFVWIVSDVINI